VTEETAQRIADALERIAAAFERELVEAPPPPCLHPAEGQTSHAVMGHPDWFECDPRKGGCGFKNF
jgi:hypothetical protein